MASHGLFRRTALSAFYVRPDNVPSLMHMLLAKPPSGSCILSCSLRYHLVSAVHQVDWQFNLAPEHQEEWTESCGGMDARVVRQTEFTYMLLPISLMVASCSGQHIQ